LTGERTARWDLGSTFDQIQPLFARRVPKTDHENGPTFPWVSIAVLARMEKVTSVLIHSRPCRAHRDSRAPCCDHHVGGPPSPLARSRFPRPVHPLHSMHCLTEVRPEGEMLLVELQVLDNLIPSGITPANSWALAGRAMPRSPSGSADVDGRSVGATMPQRRPRLLRSRTPGPVFESQPQSPDQRPKPRSPESRQFHSSS